MFSTRSSMIVCALGAAILYTAGCGAPASQPNSTTATPPPSPSPTPTPSPSPSSPSSGGVTISAPASGATVSSPFTLTASAASCSSQTVTSMSYSLDSAAAVTASGTTLSAQVTAASGAHTLHVTATGDSGATCSGSVSISVTAPAPAPAPPSNPLIPSNAVNVSNIETLSSWQMQHDPATGSTSSGAMSLVSSPAMSGQSREFDTSFSGSGGEIYHITWGNDQTSQNFFYDGWVYLTDSASTIANLELDMNQVVANGDTIIYGFQCDGYSGTWDYTENAGTPIQPNDKWVHSSSACNVRNWSRNAWHHIQIGYSRDTSGNVTYHSVWLDGTENKINATVPSAFSLGWGSVLLTNFQIDGLNSGSNTVYLNQLTISRW